VKAKNRQVDKVVRQVPSICMNGRIGIFCMVEKIKGSPRDQIFAQMCVCFPN